MTLSAPSLIAGFLSSAVAQLLIALALNAWGRWVAQRHGTAFWRRAALLPFVALGSSLLGVTIAVSLMIRAFAVVDGADPGRKAEMLAERVSDALNFSVPLAALALLLYLASLSIVIVGSLRRPRIGESSVERRG